MSSQKSLRYVPILTGLFWIAVAICVLIAWQPPPEGALYWVRGALFSLLAFFGLHSLKIGFFASDSRIDRLTKGES